jgi:hypothetical protein
MMTRYFALAVGIVYLLVGLLGFFPAANPIPAAGGPFPHPSLAVDNFYGHQLGLFPINILHNIVHLAIGLWGILAYRSFSGARGFARGLTIFYLLLAVLGLPFMPGIIKTTFGLIPLYGADTLLHLVTGLVAAYFGFMARDEDQGRRTDEVIDASRARRY